MAIFVKQNGQWRKIDSPYVKKDGQWILPEEAYIKENGEWKLIFDRFAFVVETIGRTETQEAAVLEGRLNNFGNTPNAINEAGHFRTTLTESLAAPAVAISQEAGRIAVGGIGDSVYVYDLNFNFIGELIEPTNDISSLDIDDATGEIAASDLGGSTYVYDSDFNLITQIAYPSGNPLSVSYNQESGTTGTLAIGGEDNNAYIYDDTYTQIDSVSFPATVRSVDWRQSDGYLAVGGDDPNVRIFDNSFSLDQTVNTNHQGTTKVAFGSANGQLGVLDEQKIHVYSNNFTRQDTLTQGGGGPTGDIAWDGSGRIAHGSQDDFVYVYDQNASLIKAFDEGQRDYQSIDWGPEQLLVAGTLQQQDGEAYVYSTAVSGFFEWGIDGTGTPNRARSAPLQSEGVSYTFDLDGLNPNTVYDFRAGAEASEGRTAFGDTLSFETPELDVQTNPVPSGDIDPTSADVSGEVTAFDRPTRLPAVSIEWGEAGNGFPNEVDLGSSDGTFSAALTGLDTATDYQFRAKAKFGGVTERGVTEIFTTDDLIINIDTLPAQNVTKSSASLRGEITSIVGASSADTFFEFREVGNQGFNRLPSSGFETLNSFPSTVTLNLPGLSSNEDYEYRFVTDTGFDGGLETFTTPAFDITIDSANWDLRGSTFTGSENLTFGNSAAVDATISEFDGQSYNYEVREKISGITQGTVVSGTNNTSTLNLNWNVGDSFTEGDATDSDTIEYELFVDTTIDGASSNDNATVSGNYIQSPQISIQSNVTISADEGSFTEEDIGVTETSQLETLNLNSISIDNDSSGNFSLQSSTNETVSANSTEQITIRYAPPVGSSGTDNADLTFNHDGKNEPDPFTVNLTGQVNVSTTAALASGQSGSVSFGDTFITNDSSTQTINVTETSGSGSYNINSVNISGVNSNEYTIDQSTVPSSVDDNGASFDVEFLPNSNGTKNATVEINHDADNGPNPLTVDVIGQALQETTITVEDEDISVIEGNSGTVQVTIEETAGDFGATINSVDKSSAPDLGLWQVSNVPNSVGAGSTATFDVQFSPQDENDDQTLTLDIEYEGEDVGGTFTNTTQSTVEGTANLQVDVTIDVSPNDLDFGTASAPETKDYTVTNNGNVNIDVGTTQPSSPFSITSSPGNNISPGSDTTITIEYDPSGTGPSNDSITVTGEETSGTSTDVETVNMSGDGIPENPTVDITPGSFDYGEGNGTKVFDVTNDGNVSLSGVNASISGTDVGEFSISSGLGTSTLNVGQTEQVTVDYTPSDTTPDDADLDISTNEGANDSAILSGDGVPENASISISPNSFDFGTGAGNTTFDVTNDGNVSLSGVNVGIFGTDDDEFTISSGLGTSTLNVGQTEQVTVDYTPSTAAEDDSASLEANSSEGGSDSATLSGNGQPSNFELNISPTTADFGTSGGTQQFTVSAPITNTGPVTNVSSNVTNDIGSEFQIQSGTGFSNEDISPGNNRTFTVEYTPSDTNNDFGDAEANGTEGSASASLSGDGLVAGFVQTINAPGDVDVEENSTVTATGGTIIFGGETNVSYSVSATAAAASSSNISASSSASGTVDPNTTSSVNFSVDVTGNTESTGNTITAEETNSNESDEFNADVFVDPAPSIDNFAFGVQAGNSTSDTNTVTNVGTGTNSDLTVTDASLSTSDSELSISRSGKDVTVTADATSANGGETYAGTVTVTDDGASSALEDEDTDTANVTVNVGSDPQISVSNVTFNADANAITTTTTPVNNSGTGTINPTSASISGDSELSATLINGGDDVEITADVGSNVTNTTTFTGTLTVTGSNSSDTSSVTANVVTDPSISITPTSHDFGTTNSGSKTFTLENTGDVDLASISASGLSGDFSQNGVQDSTLTPNQTTTVTVDYNPNDVNNSSDTLNISTDTTASASANVSGNGQPVDATLTISLDNNGDFGTGGGNATATVEAPISNNVDITGVSKNVSNDSGSEFGSSGSISSTFAPGDSETFTVSYNPSDVNSDNGDVSVSGSENTSDSVPLSGNGQPVSADINISLANGGSFGTASGLEITTATVSTPSSNNVDINNVSINVANDSGSEFGSDGSVSSTFSPNQSENFTVEYNPSDVSGDNGDASVSGTDSENNGNVSDSVPLSGDGEPVSADINISLDNGGSFGTGASDTGGTISAPFSNNVDVTTDGISLNGNDFNLLSDTKLDVLSPDESLSLNPLVSYDPSDTSTDSGTITIDIQENSNSDSVQLSGNGQAATVTLSVDSQLSMNSNSVDAGSTITGSVTIRNDGNTEATNFSPNLSVTQGGVQSKSITADGDGNIPANGGTETYTVTAETFFASSDNTTIELEVNHPDISPTSDTFDINNYDLSLGTLTLDNVSGTNTTQSSVTLSNDGALSYEDNFGSSQASISASVTQGSGTANILNFSDTAIPAGGSETFDVEVDPDEGSLSDGDQIEVTLNVTDDGFLNQNFTKTDTLTWSYGANLVVDSSLILPDPVFRGQNPSGFATIKNTGNQDADISASPEIENRPTIKNNTVSPNSFTLSPGATKNFIYDFDTDASSTDEPDVPIDVTIELTENNSGEVTSALSNNFTISDAPDLSFTINSYTIDESSNSGTLDFNTTPSTAVGSNYTLDFDNGTSASLGSSDVNDGSVTISDSNTAANDSITITLTREFDSINPDASDSSTTTASAA
jgi:hypothetical protein